MLLFPYILFTSPLPLTSYIIFLGSFFLGLTDGQKSCIENANSSPNVRSRFSDAQLSAMCRREEDWSSKSVNSLGRSLDDLLTPNQVTWFDSIQTCDFICICKKVPICAKVLETFGSLITGNIGEGISEVTEELSRLGGEGGGSNSGISSVIDVFKGAGGGGGGGRRKRQISLSALMQQLPAARRKEYRMMTDQERQNFHNNLNKLKNERVDGMSKYDILVVYHRAENSPGAHFGPAFLPFHRELLKHLETALRLQDQSVSLPYWDSTLDEPLPDPTQSIIWSPNFMGSGFGVVQSGPFSNWRALEDQKAREISPSLRLFRNLGKNQFGSLLKESDIQKINSAQEFRQLTFCIDPFFELVHGAVHMWVGGFMDPLELSPSDPIFFMLHAHVDKIWDDWRRRKQSPAQRISVYPPNNEACNNFHFADSIMKPFKVRNIEGLKDMDELYMYDPRPTCSRNNPDCGSPYIFCDQRSFKCRSKVTVGANCRGFEGTGICLGGECQNGRCNQQVNTPPPAVFTRPPQTLPPVTRPPLITTRAWSVRTLRFTTTRPPSRTDTVWFPVTVQKYRGRFASPATDARILARDLSTGSVYEGSVSSETEYPFFPGAAFAQVPNPALRHVDVEIEVRSSDGTQCTPLCLSQGTIYIKCVPRVSLDANPDSSDPIPFTTIEEQAPFLNWDDGPNRNPDPYLFLCGESSQNTINEVNSRMKENLGKPTTPHPVSALEEGCINKHRCCLLWANVGECERNSNWMSGGCSRACAQCQTLRVYGNCENVFADCDAWRENGECVKNPLWMEENCPRSCAVCARTAGQLNSLCGQPSRGGTECKDLNPACARWAQNGNCGSNPWWMENNCAFSCKKCN